MCQQLGYIAEFSSPNDIVMTSTHIILFIENHKKIEYMYGYSGLQVILLLTVIYIY